MYESAKLTHTVCGLCSCGVNGLQVLQLSFRIYMGQKRYHDAMRVALRLNEMPLIEQSFGEQCAFVVVAAPLDPPLLTATLRVMRECGGGREWGVCGWGRGGGPGPAGLTGCAAGLGSTS
jgi:hypothetical protein